MFFFIVLGPGTLDVCVFSLTDMRILQGRVFWLMLASCAHIASLKEFPNSATLLTIPPLDVNSFVMSPSMLPHKPSI